MSSSQYGPPIDYDRYLRSAHWKRIRQRIMKRDGHLCVCCDGRASEIHHLTYEIKVLDGEDDTKLAAICKECHRQLEFNNDGKKRSDICEKQTLFEEMKDAFGRRKELNDRLREKAKDRCIWCKGRTDIPFPWPSQEASAYVLGLKSGYTLQIWLCHGCQRLIGDSPNGMSRTDDEKLSILHGKPVIHYTRRKPSISFKFAKSFKILTAMQREGLYNEFRWNSFHLYVQSEMRADSESEFEELADAYQRTQANGRGKRSSFDSLL
jgi:hypothetical protein